MVCLEAPGHPRGATLVFEIELLGVKGKIGAGAGQERG